MDKPLVTIIVLNWNGMEDTLETLESLSHVTYPRFQTIVVDNGSTDGSQHMIKHRFPKIKLIENCTNLGFAGGSNQGITCALEQGADAVLLLNNDVKVAPDFLDHMVEMLYSSPDIGAVNPKIYYYAEPNIIWSAGGTINYHNCTTNQRFIGELDRGQADTVEEVDFAVGCALLVKRETIEKAGVLDPDFFLYYEETEWCHRIRKSGLKIVYIPGSRVWHKVSRSIADKPRLMLYYFCRNRLLFGEKCGLGAFKITLTAAFGLGRIVAGYLVHGKFERSWIVLRAMFDYYRSATERAAYYK